MNTTGKGVASTVVDTRKVTLVELAASGGHALRNVLGESAPVTPSPSFNATV